MKIITSITTAILLFLASSSSIASIPDEHIENYAIGEIPEEMRENADAVIRFESTNYNVVNESFSKVTHTQIVTLLNKSARYDQLYVPYDKFSKVLKIEAVIYDANGKIIRKLKKSDITDHSAVAGYSLYDDNRFKHLEALHNSYPYTVKYYYEVTHNSLFFFPNWNIQSRYKTSVERSECTVTLPKEIGLQYKNNNTDVVPAITFEGKNKDRVYTWQIQGIKAVKAEPFSPNRNKVFPSVELAPTKFILDGYQGDMSSWEKLGKFFYNLNKGRENLSPAMQKKVAELIAGAKDKDEIVERLYKYMQDNTRYVSVQLGVGGWQSFPPDYVEKNQYGDCKALTYYMRAMLKSAGITAYPALIRNDENIYELSEDFSFPAFNHVILYVPDDKNPKWLECTSSYNPVGYIGYTNENRQALLVTPEGGKLIRTPKKGEHNHIKIQTAIVEINDKGGAKVAAKSVNYEDEQDQLRYMFHEIAKEEQKEIIQKGLSLPTFSVENMDLTISKEEPRADLAFNLDIPKYGSQLGKRLFLKPNILNRRTKIPRSIKNRVHSIERSLGYTHLDTIRFQLPDGYEIENLPYDNFKIETDFGNYYITTALKGNELTYTRHLEVLAFSLPKERYEDLRDFYSKIVKVDNMKIVLVRNKP